MPRWFLSYHSPEVSLAEQLKDAIERSDSNARVFFAPTGLRAGSFWSRTLADEITEADAFILLVGERGLGDWQVLEYDEALDRKVKSPDFPLVLVLVAGQVAPGLPFLRQLHWIVSPDPTSEKEVGRLIEAVAGRSTRPGELWRYTSPYRGLAAMQEKDSDYFFGRGRETIEVLSALAAAPDRLPVLIGNSGVGKSSLAQAGVLAALKRQAWPEEAGAPNAWPEAFKDSRQWCFLTLKPGTEPIKALVDSFFDTWQFIAIDPERVKHQNGWIELLRDGKATLRNLLDATERRYHELDQPKPPAFFLYVDQGEELYVRAEEHQGRRFSEILAQALTDPRLRTMMSMRSDFLGGLHGDEPLFNARQQIDVPPLREAELRKVVCRPAELLSARFETPGLADIIIRRTAEDSVKDVGALPLLSYTLDDMWTQMVKDDVGVLRLPAQSFELGGVLVDRANSFLATHTGAEDMLRRMLTLRLATVRDGEEPTRRRAVRSEFSEQEWRLISELADHPYRLLVTVTPEGGETYVEVAHEAIFRRWDRVRDWIAAKRQFLAWRSGLEAARRAWQAMPDASKHDALLMGAALTQAESWFAKGAEDLSEPDQKFIMLSIERERNVLGRARRGRVFLYALLIGMIALLVGWINQSPIKDGWRWYWTARPFVAANIRPYVLTGPAEQRLNPKDSFRECKVESGADYCPEMIVVPAGSFIMGSPPTEKDRNYDEGPQHSVTIPKPFAVSKFELTFDEWDICVRYGDCPEGVRDSGWGRGQRPVINVTRNDAQSYVVWLSKITAKPYRLLTEAEFEYATRAESKTAYPWGDEIGKNNANCDGCGSQWDNSQTAPVGSFTANGFGLFDMVGNVWEWLEDCYHPSYEIQTPEGKVDAPTDGSAWTGSNCLRYVVRSGAWGKPRGMVRSAHRGYNSTDDRLNGLGFRLGRTLITP